MNAVDLLERQHAEIKSAFRRAALPGVAGKRGFRDLVRLLAVHEASEEAHVHPTARRLLRSGKVVTAARRGEEKRAKTLLAELWRMGGPDARGYRRKLMALRRAVLAHAAAEEREEFRALREGAGKLRLWLLGQEIKLTQAVAPTRPHARVNNEMANKLAAPLFGPLDRTRDLGRRLVFRR